MRDTGSPGGSEARPGQRRPRLTEAANLIWGALLIRLRPAPPGARLAVWRDALAIFSVAVPDGTPSG